MFVFEFPVEAFWHAMFVGGAIAVGVIAGPSQCVVVKAAPVPVPVVA